MCENCMYENGIGIIPWYNEEEDCFHVVNIDGDILLTSYDYVECCDLITSLTGVLPFF